MRRKVPGWADLEDKDGKIILYEEMTFATFKEAYEFNKIDDGRVKGEIIKNREFYSGTNKVMQNQISDLKPEDYEE